MFVFRNLSNGYSVSVINIVHHLPRMSIEENIMAISEPSLLQFKNFCNSKTFGNSGVVPYSSLLFSVCKSASSQCLKPMSLIFVLQGVHCREEALPWSFSILGCKLLSKWYENENLYWRCQWCQTVTVHVSNHSDEGLERRNSSPAFQSSPSSSDAPMSPICSL